MTENPRDPDLKDPLAQSRRGLLKCAFWAGTGVVWAVSGGIPRALSLSEPALAAERTDFTFVQISDSHIGFHKAANPDPSLTLQEAIARVRELPVAPALMLHTGDVSQLSKPREFDEAEHIIGRAGLDVHYVPGEHDVLIDDGKPFFDRFSKGAANGWYSFDQGGIHFIALVNVVNLKPGGFGALGPDQLNWLARDLAGRSASTPIVVFTHMPLWTIYADWGWGTDDGPQALGYLKRFGSVTVLSGHIHQIIQKVEGHVHFHTARSTAFPQPAPGQGAGPAPLKVASDRLLSTLGIATIEHVHTERPLAITDRALSV